MATSNQDVILVAGGAGFIGSHLCRKLLGGGHRVVCVDNFFSSRPTNIATLMDNPNFTFVEHDITSPLDLKAHKIYNLACPASPIHYQRDPLYTVRTNVVGTLNLLDLAQKNNAIFLQASTSEVYGDPKVHPQPESYWGYVNPIGPRSCYDEGKRCAETLCFDYNRQLNLDTRVVRIFNTFGPNMQPDDGRVVSNFITQALDNKPITIYGDGSQTRSFCYVDDLVKGLELMMNSSKSFSTPVNFGNPSEFTVLELAETVIQLCKSSSTLDFMSLPQDDPKQRKPDIGLARELFGWQPEVDLPSGLQRTIDYFKSHIDFL
jgi:UDP-glucuronate decarboxylase